jgi:hypothetical protein
MDRYLKVVFESIKCQKPLTVCTFQRPEVYKKLLANGELRCSWNEGVLHPDFDREFWEVPYRWLRDYMYLNGYSSRRYFWPFWFYVYPDTRRILWQEHYDKDSGGWTKGLVYLRFKIHPSRMLISDMDGWSFVSMLTGVTFSREESDLHDELVSGHCFRKRIKISKRTWPRIFELERFVQNDWIGPISKLQGTTDSLRMDELVSVRYM